MIELFVPGRLCLLGEHSDWAAGYRVTHPEIPPGVCLVSGTDQGLRAVCEPAENLEIETVLPDGSLRGPERIAFRIEALEAHARSGGFFSYAAGVAAVLARRGVTGGVRIRVVEDDLPVGRGLSSSAAICVLVVRAFSRLHGLGLDRAAEMELAYAGERRTGSECGRMDQICAYGRRCQRVHFDGEDLSLEEVVPARPLSLLIVDLKAAKDTRRILADLNRCFPAAPGERAAGVREALGSRNAELVARATAAIRAGDPEALGRSMVEAQRVFDRLVAPASSELCAPKLHGLLESARASGLSLGGKGVGSQGDGSAQLVTRGPAERARLAKRLKRDHGVRCVPLTLGEFQRAR